MCVSGLSGRAEEVEAGPSHAVAGVASCHSVLQHGSAQARRTPPIQADREMGPPIDNAGSAITRAILHSG